MSGSNNTVTRIEMAGWDFASQMALGTDFQRL